MDDPQNAFGTASNMTASPRNTSSVCPLGPRQRHKLMLSRETALTLSHGQEQQLSTQADKTTFKIWF